MVFEFSDVVFQGEVLGYVCQDQPVSSLAFYVCMDKCFSEFGDKIWKSPEVGSRCFECILDDSGCPGFCRSLFHKGEGECDTRLFSVVYFFVYMEVDLD